MELCNQSERMVEDEVIMISYCMVTFGLSALLFILRNLLLQDAANSRVSRAEEYVRPVEVAAWVLLWYGVSVSMIMANRWLFHDWNSTGFQFPIVTTMIHMWLKVIVSRVVLYWCRCQGMPRPTTLGWSVFWKVVVIIGLATSGDIVLSNLSFTYATVTFYTIVKSGSLMWILIWALVFRFEKLSIQILGVVTVISSGLFLASYGQTDFSMAGLIMILGASCFSGLRWALVQVLQAVEPSCSNPMVVIYHIAPPSAVVMVPMAVLEVIRKGDIASSRITTTAVVEVAVVIAGAGLFSFMLIFAEVKLLTMSSSLTMGVFGTLKEVVQIAMAVAIFDDRITWYKISGLALATLGSVAYKMAKGRPQHGSREVGAEQMKSRQPTLGAGSLNGLEVTNGTGALLPYSAVSQQEVDEELRVFRYTNAEMELEGELEEFSSFTSLG